MSWDRAVGRRWGIWSPVLVPRLVWAARRTAVRGQWSWGDFRGTMVIVGVLAALVVFVLWRPLATAAVLAMPLGLET